MEKDFPPNTKTTRDSYLGVLQVVSFCMAIPLTSSQQSFRLPGAHPSLRLGEGIMTWVPAQFSSDLCGFRYQVVCDSLSMGHGYAVAMVRNSVVWAEAARGLPGSPRQGLPAWPKLLNKWPT